MSNLAIYNAVRTVPDEAKKTIQAGRLRGFTDINPMWRIKVLTELFGPCGFGWSYEITNKFLEVSGNEIRAFVDINLYVKYAGEWSRAIPGTGGSSFATMEKSGLHVSDECYKMALTDAISVASKSLGIGADVYFEKDKTKYDDEQPDNSSRQQKAPAQKPPATSQNPPGFAGRNQVQRIQILMKEIGITDRDECIARTNAWLKRNGGREISTTNELTEKQADQLIITLERQTRGTSVQPGQDPFAGMSQQ